MYTFVLISSVTAHAVRQCQALLGTRIKMQEHLLSGLVSNAFAIVYFVVKSHLL